MKNIYRPAFLVLVMLTSMFFLGCGGGGGGGDSGSNQGNQNGEYFEEISKVTKKLPQAVRAAKIRFSH